MIEIISDYWLTAVVVLIIYGVVRTSPKERDADLRKGKMENHHKS